MVCSERYPSPGSYETKYDRRPIYKMTTRCRTTIPKARQSSSPSRRESTYPVYPQSPPSPLRLTYPVVRVHVKIIHPESRRRKNDAVSMVPILNLHTPVIVELLVHLERVPQHMRLVTPPLLQTFVFGAVKVVLQNRLVVGMSALFDDEASSFPGREASDVG